MLKMNPIANIADAVARIRAPDEAAMDEARALQDRLTKPRGSLGVLEDLSIRLAGIYRTPRPEIRKKTVFTFAGDHGVTAEGISAYPSDVTAQMVLNFASGGAAINVLSRHARADVRIVDIGVSSEVAWPEPVVSRKVARGTRNMARGPSMTRSEAEEAVGIGIELASEAVRSGSNALAVGDMGIGNTTAASAITAAFTGRPVRLVTGRGTGVDDATLELKIKTLEKALEVNRPDPGDGLDVLAKVGGLEIAGLTGVILGAASEGVPVFLDGFVTASAALAAHSISRNSREYMIPSHVSVEPGHRHALEHLGLVPILDLRMRLGEGTGATLGFLVAEAACKILCEMATFESANISHSLEEGTK